MSDSPPPPPPPLFATRDESALLASARVKALLGSGSNGVVLSVTFPDALPGPTDEGEVGKLFALKIMSHFWDRSGE